MYIPNSFHIEDKQLITAFIQKNSFGLLLSQNTTTPVVTHLPFILKEQGDDLLLYTHLAKANPHWEHLDDKECLCVFTGPHAYISPSWYVNPINVPTWNYTAVHVHAHCKILHTVESILEETMSVYEPSFLARYKELPEPYKDSMLTHIVGLELKVKHIEAKFKLNQNKSKDDIKQVIQHLNESNNTTHHELAELMKQHNKL